MTTIDRALQDIMQMDYNTREILIELLQKRQIEARRDAIAKAAKKSLNDYKEGKTIAENSDSIISKLNSL